ncbi:MAG: RNA 2'-phosphotransferase, partial [Pseudomonadota bacterium]
MKRTSKFLSLVLRHKPETIGLTLDPEGWVAVDVLLPALATAGHQISRLELETLVAENDKKRFTLSDDGAWIRAAQGHSVQLQNWMVPVTPPETLFHGTATKSVASILESGLEPRNRLHVHLSADVETAVRVGQRHGRPVVLTVAAKA